MSTLANVRAGLAFNLAAISGLHVDAYEPANVVTPHAWVGSPEIRYDDTMARGSDTHVYPITLAVSIGHGSTADQALEAFLDSAGDSSIKAALEADVTLSDAAQSLRVVSCSASSLFSVESLTYVAVTFQVEVIV